MADGLFVRLGVSVDPNRAARGSPVSRSAPQAEFSAVGIDQFNF